MGRWVPSGGLKKGNDKSPYVCVCSFVCLGWLDLCFAVMVEGPPLLFSCGAERSIKLTANMHSSLAKEGLWGGKPKERK